MCGSVVTYSNFNGTVLGKEIKITGLKNKAQLTKLLEESRKYISDLPKTPKQTHYLYDCRERTMTKLSNIKHCPRHSLFLKEGQAEQLFDCVKTFVDSKEEYEKYFVPYKLNIFHGLPGTGKTSLINMVATEFKLDVMIVPFSPFLTVLPDKYKGMVFGRPPAGGPLRLSESRHGSSHGCFGMPFKGSEETVGMPFKGSEETE